MSSSLSSARINEYKKNTTNTVRKNAKIMERQQYLKNMNTKKQCTIKRCSNKIGIENKTCPREIVLGVTSCNHIIKVSIEKCILTKITKCLLMGNMVRERQLRRCVLCVYDA